jgi:hypothetical protein
LSDSVTKSFTLGGKTATLGQVDFGLSAIGVIVDDSVFNLSSIGFAIGAFAIGVLAFGSGFLSAFWYLTLMMIYLIAIKLLMYV